MTTITAVKKGRQLCIASDTLTLFGERKEVAERHVLNDCKILRVGENYIGIAGHPSWSLILNHYFLKEKAPTWATADQIFDNLTIFLQHCKKYYFFKPTYSRYEPVESSDFAMLIINLHGIFEVDHLRVVRQHSQFSAIGTGEEYALGAMKAVYNDLDNTEEIAKIGIAAAAEFDRKTGPAFHMRCIQTV